MSAVFPPAEFAHRVQRAQTGLAASGCAALLLTQEADIRYFTGFLTRFWESPTRPWFLVLPTKGQPVAVIPSIGADLMKRTFQGEIRTWAAPQPEDDGISRLCDTLRELTGKSGQIAIPSALESHMRMPRATYLALEAAFEGRLKDDGGLVANLRAIKSPREVDLVRNACAIAGRAFGRVGDIARAGDALETVFRRFQMLCLEEGADWVGYLAGGAGQGGYSDVISPATARQLEAGDVLMLDTGVVHNGYFCDFDRNFSVGLPNAATREAHAALVQATQAGLAVTRPGATAADLHSAMARSLGPACLDGRLGHGLGLQLTEGMSLIPADHTELVEGMVLTLEPGIGLGDGKIMVHEENILVTATGAEPLSPFAGTEIPCLEA